MIPSSTIVPFGLAKRARRMVPLLAMTLLAPSTFPAGDLGLFTGHTDVGATGRAGTVGFDPVRGTYAVGGSGENMWGPVDAFHYVWKQASGDVALTADITFPKPGGHPHRKACLVIRQTLDADSAYADAALHGDGLTSLQFRESRGGPTREVQASTIAPRRLRIEKIGQTVYLSLAGEGDDLQTTGCSVSLAFEDPFYLGLGVCAHDNAAFETAVFSRVEITPPSGSVARVRSSLETIAINSGDRRSVYHSEDHFEAPNWTPDGRDLIFNSKGRLYRIPVDGSAPPALIDTGFAIKCNNDHGLSPDGQTLVISDQTETGRSIIYTLPATGGAPRRVTANAPSYWHGWSPDGKTLAYCAERGGDYDIYTIPVEGGDETRLTTAPGLDDGPDYTPDGRFIYFNSERTGRMQIWRMRPDGSNQEQMTSDGFNDWFPHPSPDGKWIVFLSYGPEVKGHPPDKDVRLRLMPVGGGEIRDLARFNGGQGTINVPSWAPDSSRFAYVRYQPVAAP